MGCGYGHLGLAYNLKLTLSQGVSMDIGEVAERTGLPASALRFYEAQGLIQSIGRVGLRRQYADTVIERLGLIALARNGGFSLQEIAAMLGTAPSINCRLLAEKADELDKKIAELIAMRDGLRHAVACKAPNHFECPKFLRLVNLAAKHRRRTPNKLKDTKVHYGPEEKKKPSAKPKSR